MIFDFYENFPSIYPISIEFLLNPDRDKIGYYWDFEDYLVEGNLGKGQNLQGILIASEADLSMFIGLFDTGFRMTVINSRIKDKDPNLVMFSESVHLKEYRESIIKRIKKEFAEAIDNRDFLIESLKKEIKKNKIWIPLNNSWGSLSETENKIFWGTGVKINRLPSFFSVMNLKELWIEIDKKGPSIFKEDEAWTDLAFQHLDLIKYIDESVAERIGISYLSDIRDLGLI